MRVAVDARLLFGAFTGDSSYWKGLHHGLAQVESPLEVLSCFRGSVPSTFKGTGIGINARTGRWFSLVAWPLWCRRNGINVAHTQYNVSPLLGPRAVTTIHDVSFLIGPEWFRPRDRALLQRGVPASVARAGAVITVSETSKGEIEHHIPAARGKTHVTYNALDPDFDPPKRTEAAQLLERDLGLSGPFLLTVGTRWPRKNLKLAVEATRGIGIPLVIAGKFGWGDEAKEPHVVLPGYVSAELLQALYAAAKVYLAPSLHEGFGIPLLESWAAETPVICGSGGALPEVAGDAALVLSTYDPVDWHRELRGLLADSGKVERMRVAGKERLKRFSWKETARKTLEIYELVGQSRP